MILPSHRVWRQSCGSTNDEAARLASAGAPDGTVVVAREQTAGRGRQGRAWHSPAGENLYLSCVLRPQLPPIRLVGLTLAAGIAVCDAINFFGVRASLKWPNDVLASRKKLAGILTEMSSRGQVVEHVIVGVGVDANTLEFPAELADTATSMRIERAATTAAARGATTAAVRGATTSATAPGAPIDLGELEARVLFELGTWLPRFFSGGMPGIRREWERRAQLGTRVRAGAIEGVSIGLDDSGALRVADDAGVEHALSAGDVSETEGGTR